MKAAFFNIKTHVFLLAAFILLLNGNAYPEIKSEYNWFCVFYESENSGSQQSFVIRPFYLKNTEPKKTFKASLMPIIYWGYYEERKSEWKSLFGLVGSLDYVHRNNVNDYDFGFFPFLLYGASKDTSDRYFHLWPVGGTIRGKLGQDRITTYAFPGIALFLLFPPALTVSYTLTWTTIAVFIASIFPAYVDYESRDYKAHGILWPLVQWGKSQDRDDFRILPFYSHNYKKDYYDNKSYLMVLITGRAFLKDDEQKTFFLFPFYGKRWNISDKVNASTLLWPFFSYGVDSKRGSFELTFLWPVVMVQDSVDPYIKKRIVFPFYGDYEFEKKSLIFITPLYIALKTESKNFDSEYYFNMLIIWFFKRDYRKEPSPEYGSSWRYFKIWPLFQLEWDDTGGYSFNCMSVLPFRDPDGYEKLYQPFWTIFELSRTQTGERRLGLIFRLYYQRWGDNFLYIKMPFLFSYSSSPDRSNSLSFTDFFSAFCYNNDKDGIQFSLLFSMFGYNNDEEGRYIRIFWIPIGIGEGKADKTSRGAARDAGHGDYDYEGIGPEGYRRSDFFAGNEAVLYKMRIF